VKLNRKLTIAGLVLGVLLFIGGWRAIDLYGSRADLLATADARAQNLAHILAEYLSGAFAGGDAALRQLTIHAARIGGLDAPPDEWLAGLSQARAGLTGIGAMSVVDRKARIRYSTRPEIVGQIRDEWIIREGLSPNVGDTLIVGTPVGVVVAPFGYVIPLARPLLAADGTRYGVVVASFIPNELRAFFGTVDVGQHGTVWVFHAGGTVLVREPSDTDSLGQTAAGNPLFDAATRAPRALFRGVTGPSGRVQRAAFERVGTVPLSVAVALDESEVLAPWRRELVLSIVAMVGVAFVCGVTVLALFRQMDVAEGAARTLADARAAEAEHLREAHEQLEAAFAREQRARAHAEEASALKDEFLMTASHELRTPLGVILTGATLLGSGRLTDPERAQTIDAIARNARTQARLVGDLLDVAKGMSGNLRLDVSAVAVADVVRSAVETVKVAADAKAVRLDVRVDPAAGTVVGDGARLQQVLWNLLSNAVKFTPAGGEVCVRGAREDSSVVVTVTDTGIGISPAFLPHVFDRFRQEHTGMTRPYGGLGLGLAIARHLVELHGGDLTVHSDGPGHGARFALRLPTGAAAEMEGLYGTRASKTG
jgi:signal transduction histidine kinase